MSDDVFKIRNKSGAMNTKFVGVNVPDELFLKILLYSTATGIPKSTFIKNTMLNLFNANQFAESVLLGQIIERARNTWKSKSKLDTSITLESYKAGIHTELTTKGFPVKIINQIIEGI